MCTVVTSQRAGQPLRILAVRDELVSRDFDEPAAWWPERAGAVGGRDRTAGGSWCVSDVELGVSALVLNRRERRTGTPSRGVLPLLALEHGTDWPAHVDHMAMASFTLVLAGPDAVTTWSWDAQDLLRADLPAGLHVMTTAGVDAPTRKTEWLTASAAESPWFDIVTAQQPRDDEDALVVRHPIEGDVYATVFGQLITAVPGRLDLTYSRTPWQRDGWSETSFG